MQVSTGSNITSAEAASVPLLDEPESAPLLDPELEPLLEPELEPLPEPEPPPSDPLHAQGPKLEPSLEQT